MGAPVYRGGRLRPRPAAAAAAPPDVDLVVEGDGVAFARRLAEEIGGTVLVHRSFGTASIEGGRAPAARARRRGARPRGRGLGSTRALPEAGRAARGGAGGARRGPPPSRLLGECAWRWRCRPAASAACSTRSAARRDVRRGGCGCCTRSRSSRIRRGSSGPRATRAASASGRTRLPLAALALALERPEYAGPLGPAALARARAGRRPSRGLVRRLRADCVELGALQVFGISVGASRHDISRPRQRARALGASRAGVGSRRRPSSRSSRCSLDQPAGGGRALPRPARARGRAAARVSRRRALAGRARPAARSPGGCRPARWRELLERRPGAAALAAWLRGGGAGAPADRSGISRTGARRGRGSPARDLHRARGAARAARGAVLGMLRGIGSTARAGSVAEERELVKRMARHRERRREVTPKFIFVTGGVVSSLGKGLAAASIGSLLEARGLPRDAAEDGPVHQRGRGDHEPLPARRGLRHRRRRRDRPRPRPLRALHLGADDPRQQHHHRARSTAR